MIKRSHPSSAAESGKFAYAELDRVIHERARLGIMTSLVARPDGLAFNDLKALCDLTDGNLNRHLDVLHQAGLVEVRKEQGSGRARTICCTKCVADRAGQRRRGCAVLDATVCARRFRLRRGLATTAVRRRHRTPAVRGRRRLRSHR